MKVFRNMKAYTFASILSATLHYQNRILASARKQRIEKALKLTLCAPGDRTLLFKGKYKRLAQG